MDVVLDNFRLCPPASGEYMYKQYIATKAETSIGELRANIELLVNEVASSMSDTMTDTTALKRLSTEALMIWNVSKRKSVD